MSSKFNGFSADEINKIHSKTKGARDARDRMESLGNNNLVSSDYPKMSAASQQPAAAAKSEADETAAEMHDALYFKPLNGDAHQLEEIDLEPSASEKVGQTDDDSILAKFRGISLKNLEEHRRVMEEANKEKKQILSKTIEQLYGPFSPIAFRADHLKYLFRN